MIKSVVFYDCSDITLKEYNQQDGMFYYTIYAGNGYSYNQRSLQNAVNSEYALCILTNDIKIFGDEKTKWNDKENHTQAYIVINGEPKIITSLTSKDIRKAHNIEHMYIAGAFEVE